MQFIVLTILALAISSEALYPLPHAVVPATTYGVPEEHKPVITVNHAPAAPIASVVTVKETKPASTVSYGYDYSIVHPGSAPTVLNYAAAYPAPLPSTPIVHPQPFATYGLPQQEVRPISYYGYPTYRYGYSGLQAYSYNGPSSAVVHEERKVYNPSVITYEYQVPQVPVVHEIPVVPHTTYGVPH